MVGPIHVPYLGGSMYCVSFINDFSRKPWLYFVKKKSKFFSRFREFRDFVENQTKKKIKVISMDYGAKFVVKILRNSINSVE